MCEATLYSVSTRYVEAQVEKGSRVWGLFKDLRKNVDQSLAAILTLNTIANTFGAALAGSFALGVLGEKYVPAFSAFLTIAVLLLAEIIPKTFGVVFGRQLAPLVTYLIYFIRYLMGPGVWLAGHITNLITRKRAVEKVTPEEIKTLARLSMSSGEIEPLQAKAVSGILGLKEKRVKDIMTPRTVVFSLPANMTLGEVMGLEMQWEHSRVPVYEGSLEDIVGFVLTKDVFMELAKGRRELRLADLMRPVGFLAEGTKLDLALSHFLESRQHLFVVTDEYGGMSGVVTLEDVLEEILGTEIVDESDLVEDKQKLARLRKVILKGPQRS